MVSTFQNNERKREMLECVKSSRGTFLESVGLRRPGAYLELVMYRHNLCVHTVRMIADALTRGSQWVGKSPSSPSVSRCDFYAFHVRGFSPSPRFKVIAAHIVCTHYFGVYTILRTPVHPRISVKRPAFAVSYYSPP